MILYCISKHSNESDFLTPTDAAILQPYLFESTSHKVSQKRAQSMRISDGRRVVSTSFAEHVLLSLGPPAQACISSPLSVSLFHALTLPCVVTLQWISLSLLDFCSFCVTSLVPFGTAPSQIWYPRNHPFHLCSRPYAPTLLSVSTRLLTHLHHAVLYLLLGFTSALHVHNNRTRSLLYTAYTQQSLA